MEATELLSVNWTELTDELGKQFASGADLSDESGEFVYKNYELLKKHRYFSALIPEELGGDGLSHQQMCDIIRIIAHYCGSTALAFSMHQHLVSAAVWKYKAKGEGVPMLTKVSKEQLVLVSTGARDWLGSNGEMKKVEGGYRFSAQKSFASGSSVGNVAVTSAPYMTENGEWQVLHFSVPFNMDGVSVKNDWDTMGMRATGSNTIVFNEVFIPDSAIVLTRPRNEFHAVWNLVIGVAMPLIMSAYVGIAEKALEIAISMGKNYARNQKHLPYIIGQLNNKLISAQVQLKAMYALTNNFDFTPSENVSVDMLSYKTNVADACIDAVSLAMEAVGGQGFYKKYELERLFRDVQASSFHPLPKWDQFEFTGVRILNR